MQNAGTLKKRTRRTLVKVNGYGAVQYSDEIEEDGLSISDPAVSSRSSLAVSQTENDTRISMKNIRDKFETGERKNSTRITRNPVYHWMEEGMASSEMNTQERLEKGFSDNENGATERNHDRPYLLSKGVLRRLRLIIFLGMLCANFPWIWNNKTKRIDRWSPFMVKLWKMYWYFTMTQSVGLIIYQTYCLIGIYSRDLDSYRGIFAYSLIVYWYACHLGYRTCMLLYEDDMRKYINRLLEFNHDYVEKYLVHADEGIEFSSGRMVMKLSIPAAATQIPNSLFFFLVLPSAPYYLTSKIDPLAWYALIPGAYQDLTMIGQTILTYIIISWVQVVHTSSVEFWLREMHKDIGSNYTTDELRQSKIAIPTYRSLQLMCAAFNDCMSSLCIPVWKFSVAFGFIPCGYLWIRSMNRLFIEEFPGILVYPFGAVNCFTMGFGCLQMAAEMYDIANSFIYSWSRTKQKNFKRVLMSCPTLKVKVGKYYCITAATTITFFQVITGYIIDCIITFP
ncbi:unnamed protein product [Orchesella dallaii]|uniref:Odorant receptor n=1 Tax=Orchesella dallaii TaxID=48710 RepID=A0ABP1PX12_9HEXA